MRYQEKLQEDIFFYSQFKACDTGYHRFPRLIKARINELKKYGINITHIVIKEPETE